jgi:shikimate kinase
MPTVVLLGFSCSGKSTVVEQTTKKQLNTVESKDSDEWVAEPYGGHIYDIFFGLGRQEALRVIERREREFLLSFTPSTTRCLIAAGPAVPSRDPEWQSFVARVQPEFLYLELTPDEALTRLRKRRRHHSEDPRLANQLGFGSWDEGVLTRETDGVWRDVSDAEALANIRRHMSLLVERYEALTPDPKRRLAAGTPDFLTNAIEATAVLLDQSP